MTTTPATAATEATAARVRRPAGRLVALGADLADLVWPRTCAGCLAPGQVLCAGCRGRAAPVELDDLTAGPDLVPVAVAAAYQDGVRRALIAYKERGRRELAAPLGRLLRAAVDHLLRARVDPRRPFAPPSWAGVLLVPVPSTVAARRRRGDDHVRRLAVAAGRGRAVAGPVGLLRATGVAGRRDDVEVGLDERLAGAGRYRAGRAWPGPGAGGGPVVVVDDIVTSGATARDAVVALRAAGWPVLGVAAVAATPRAVPRLPTVGAGLAVRAPGPRGPVPGPGGPVPGRGGPVPGRGGPVPGRGGPVPGSVDRTDGSDGPVPRPEGRARDPRGRARGP